MNLNHASYCSPGRHRSFGHTTKQTLSNCEPKNVETMSNFQV